MFSSLCIVFSPSGAKKRYTITIKYHAAAGESAVSESPNYMTAILIFTGSAGPSIATAAAATAIHAASQGCKTLLFSLAPTAGLSALLGSAVGAVPTPVAPQLDALALDAPTELATAWGQGRARLP